jgi:hypothetical protein
MERCIRGTRDERHRLESFSQLRFSAVPENPHAYAVSRGGREKVVLALRALDGLERSPSVRLTPRDARRLAADLLACAGAIDGSMGD